MRPKKESKRKGQNPYKLLKPVAQKASGYWLPHIKYSYAQGAVESRHMQLWKI